MPASKVGNSIYIEGLGNTLASVTSDIADTAWIEDKGGGVYEAKANHVLDIRAAGELIIGDPLDYSVFERLDMNGSSNNSIQLLVRDDATFRMYGDTEIDFFAGTYYASFTWYECRIEIQGNATYRPKHSGLYYNRSLRTGQDPVDATYLIDVDYADFVNRPPPASQSTILEFSHKMAPPANFSNCLWDGNPNYTSGQGRGRPPYHTITAPSSPDAQIIFTDCTIEHFDYHHYQWGLPWYVGCTFQNNDARAYVSNGAPHTKQGPWPIDGYTKWGQDFYPIIGCTYTKPNDGITLYITYSSVVVIKDCTFLSDISGVQVTDSSVALLWTGNTFTAGNGALVNSISGPGFIAYVHAVRVIVTDDQANPIEGASVVVRQKDGFDEWQFTTDVDGKINAHPVLDSQCLCIHKVFVSGDPVTGVFNYKSDTSNGTYHEVIVSAPGYVTQAVQQVMDQDRSLVVSLQPTGAGELGDTLDNIYSRVRRLQDR